MEEVKKVQEKQEVKNVQNENVVEKVSQENTQTQEGQQEQQRIVESLVKQEDVVKVVQDTLEYVNGFMNDFIMENGNSKTTKWVQKGFMQDLVDFLQNKLNSLEVFQLESTKPLKELVKK